MTRRRLPIGVQTFRTLRERDCYYVDKHVRFTFLTGVSKFGWRSWRRRARRSRSYGSAATRTSTEGHGEPIHLIGVELSRETRNVTALELADGWICRDLIDFRRMLLPEDQGANGVLPASAKVEGPD
ncbi:MAG: hypothetical protein OXC31_18145 [Spirochaetaceae bacterium]|nr:hypothetical protein [Spirochaetaceae bacterium]